MAAPLRTDPADRAPRAACRAAIVAALLLLAGGARGQGEGADVRGWAAEIGRAGALVAPLPSGAFALRAGESLHPAAAPDAPVLLSTLLRVPANDDYRLALEVQGGAARLELADAEGAVLLALDGEGGATSALHASDWVRLPRGELALAVRFERAGAAAARLRTLWERRDSPFGGFPREPIPARATRVAPATAERLEPEALAFEGRLLLERKGCTACHDPGAQAHAVGTRAAPRLTGVLERASGAWLERWIRSPRSLRPHADMPDVLADLEEGERERAAADLVHFLASLRAPREGAAPANGAPAAPEPSVAPSEPAVFARGRRLYHAVGCVACHGALASPASVLGDQLHSNEVPAAAVPAPFGDLAGKWRPDALAAFLRDPRATHPDGRMPALGLSADEADAIAGWLASEWGPPAPFAHDPARVESGAWAYAFLGCGACHEPKGPVEAPALAALDARRGCLDPHDASTPRYELAEHERRALASALASLGRASGAPAPSDGTRRRLVSLACAACHVLDEGGGPPDALHPFFTSSDERVDLGNEGRYPPDLAGAGAKLTSTWLRGVLLGSARARPYLSTRMPEYGEEAVGELVDGLALRDGVEPDSDVAHPRATDELVRVGRELMGREAFGCMACHVYKDYPPTGTSGPAITAFGERLRYEWFAAYMQNPQRYKPGSRMPDFATGGRSSVTSVLEGDMARQIDALWCYFGLGERMPPPEGVEPGGGMQLQIRERPMVVRAFLDEAPSRGIAVGLPQGVHFGFDAAEARLCVAWQGDFLDAAGVWAGRGGTIVGGRGPTVWTAPEGPALLLAPTGAVPAAWPESGSEAGIRFRGYRLDERGWPSFRWEIGGVRVAESFDAGVAPRLLIRRRFELAGIPPGESVWLNAGATDSPSVACPDASVERVERPDGTTWFALTPLTPNAPRVSHEKGAALACVLEVTP